MQTTYRIEYLNGLWHRFRYIIKDSDRPLYQIRRTGRRRYRQFENEFSQVIFHIAAISIKSIDGKQTIATIDINRKIIQTSFGNIHLINLDLIKRTFDLQFNDSTIVHVTTENSRLTHNEYQVKMKYIGKQYHEFILAIFILVHSVLERLQNPIAYPSLLINPV